MKQVVIIGGGVIGMCSAYYLQRSGQQVTIIDQGDMLSGCSYGNAGMIVPSHFIPLAAPGMISKGIRWMFDSSSPFYVRPSLSRDLLRWGLIFYRSATKQKVDAAAPALRDLSLYSKQNYQSLSKELGVDLQQRGLLMLYRRPETGDEEMETVEMAHKLGVEAKALSLHQVQELEPNVKVEALGGVYFPGDAHLSPHSLMTKLSGYLSASGVRFFAGKPVSDIEITNHSVRSVSINERRLECDEVVLAAGAWSGRIASQLFSVAIPMQAGKGYSFTLKNVGQNVSTPTILLDDRVAVTPMGGDLRFGGTMEIGGNNQVINMNRVRGIVEAIPRYYPEMRVTMPHKNDVWAGLRPCSPDGLPFIGRTKSVTNLTVATGHGMMGISLGPATGQLVGAIVNGTAPDVDITPFQPDRFA